ncbi:MAG: cysteine dioxygenase [Pseudomonadota bacterium]|jgi:predicted metal-dependent enzyme (double-stranded beta helix superfamily)
MAHLERLRQFIAEFTTLAATHGRDEAAMLDRGAALLGALVAHDDWLPDEATVPDPVYYRQYLLHCDPLERFSVVSFVWGPGQRTPVHDHCTWGMVGMLRGAERCRRFARPAPGAPLQVAGEYRLEPGAVDRLSPTEGDIHEVSNALDDRVSISVHVYGANIGAVSRHVYDPATGEEKPFVSGYSSPQVPNLWDRSAEVRATLAR